MNKSVRIELIWDCWSSYINPIENIQDQEIIEFYFSEMQDEHEAICECLKNAADQWDWDDECVINFESQSELIETGRDLKTANVIIDSKQEELSETYVDLFYRYQDISMGLEDLTDGQMSMSLANFLR